MGDPPARPERERNRAWRFFTGLPTHVVRTAGQQREFERAVVADLCEASPRFRDTAAPTEHGFS